MSEINRWTSLARRVAAAGTGALPLVIVVLTWLLWRAELPSELAIHWSGTGTPDGFAATGNVLLGTLLMTGIPALLGFILAAIASLRPALLRGSLGSLGAVAGLGAAMWLVSAGLTLQAGDPQQAKLGGWVVALSLSVAYSLVPYFIAPKPKFTAIKHENRLPLGEQETGAWSRTITSKMLLWMPVALLAFGAAVMLPALLDGEFAAMWISGGALLASALVVTLIAHMQVTVDRRGLRLVSTVGRIAIERIPLENIVSVEATEIRPAEWGGWGYRILPGRSAVVMGAGPGLIVTTTADKQFAVTVDDPETAASLLLALRDRKHDGGTNRSDSAATA